MGIFNYLQRQRRSTSPHTQRRGSTTSFGRRWTRLALVAGLVGGAVVAPWASPAPVSALQPIACQGPEIVVTNWLSTYLYNTDNKSYSKIITSSWDPDPGNAIVIQDLVQLNQIGVVDGGNTVIFTGRKHDGPDPNTGYQDKPIFVFEVDLTTGAVTSEPAPDIGVSGGINLADDRYYFGGYTEIAGTNVDMLGTFSTYNPATDTLENAKGFEVVLPDGPGNFGDKATNGDLMFDRSGNMYILVSGAGEWKIYTVNGVPSNRPVKVTGNLLASGTATDVLNGLAFGNDGLIYASGTFRIRAFDTKGTLVSDDNRPEIQALRLTDTASCIDPPRVRLYKDLPNGRVKSGDQFGLAITGPLIDEGNNTVTIGEEPGLQEQLIPATGVREFVGPVISKGGSSVTITESAAGGTNLADYSTSVKCTDEATGADISVTGSGTSHSLTMPISNFGTPSADIVCIYANVAAPTLTVQKDLPEGRLAATDQFTMTVTPGNAKATTTGSATGIQPDKAVVDPAAFDTAYTFTETGTGTTNLDFYDTEWVCVDTANDNAPLGNGTGTSGTLTIKSAAVSPAALCTFKNTPKKPDLKMTKSVNPASGTPVQVGQTLDYTVSYTNNGGAPANVDMVDDISGVLDDAELTVNPSVTSGTAIAVSGVIDGKFTMKGTLPPGATSTVTYSVKVKPDGQRGDNLLENFVLKPGETTPEECLDTNDLCTVNPVPELTIKKDVDPEDGSIVLVGQELTYTMTFDNTKGESPATVDNVDNLAGVLDDATIVEDPKLATGSGLTVSSIENGEFTIKGSLAAGETATVTYKVKVKPDNERGDSVLLNFLLPPDTPPEKICLPGDPLCTENPVPGLGVSKSVVPEDGSTVDPGEELTYTITLTNTGAAPAAVDKVDDISGIVDDAKVTEDPKLATGTGLTVSPIDNNRFTIKGTLAAGATATVTMKVVVNDPYVAPGDNVLLNFVLEPGTDKPDKCDPGDPLCTENPVPRLSVVKSVNPEDGSIVEADQELEYTLTFTNTGAGAATVERVDNLNGVLDDATVTEDPILATGTGLTVGAIENGEFPITGTLAAGETATVTMKVVVKPDTDRGDNVLLNFVLLPKEPPEEKCEPGDPECTENPVPGIGVAKTVDPEDGSTVVADQELEYTLTFSNTGAAAGTINYVDDMSGVLDDAKLTVEPALATGENLEVSAVDDDGRFTVKGTLQPGASATVTMTVVVKPDGERGDDVLLNYVLKPDETTPEDCLPGDPLCTKNPVEAPAISLVKAVASVEDVDDTNTNTIGDIVTYSFTVKNTGNVALSEVTLEDLLLSTDPLDCPKDTLEIDEEMSCTGPTHVINAADVANGSFDNTATVSGVSPTGTKVTATDDATVPAVPIIVPPTSSSTTVITIAPPTTVGPKTGSSTARSLSIAATFIVASGFFLLRLSRIRRRALS